jgi:voltage-gated potassium channel Kch
MGQFKENNFIWLTLALIGLLIGSALTRALPDAMTLQIFEVGSILLLLVSLLSLKTDRRWIRWFIVVVGVMMIMVVVDQINPNRWLGYGHLVLLLVFFAMAAWLVGTAVLFSGKVGINEVIGSISLYLMIGFIFSILYTILLEFQPNAINGLDTAQWYDNLPSTTYFSFVTLTTLGYGDMSPASEFARVLVILEAVTGMFYIAIIVASLIGAMLKR